MNKKKIIFFTRRKADMTLAHYQRTKKLMSLFETAFKSEVILFNTYDENLSHIKLILESKKKIKRFLKVLKDDVSIFVIEDLDPRSIKVVNKYALKHHIKVYIDIVEYADRKEKKFGLFSPSLLMNHKMIKKSVKKNMTVIAISSFFVDFYHKKNIKTILIPNLVNEKEMPTLLKKSDDKISFIFAGYPQKKDALDVTMLAMLDLYKEAPRAFNFHIAGIDEESFFNKYHRLNKYHSKIRDFTVFHGCVKREAIKSLYLKSHFSIIMRDPSLKVTQSGFPTKFSESLGYGCPVIANLTSDISYYLKDKYNGYIVEGFNKESLLVALKKALKDKKKYDKLESHALESAKIHFSPSTFIERLKESKDE